MLHISIFIYILQHVQLRSYDELMKFLACVPREHYQHIVQLDVCTASARTLVLKSSSPHPRTDALSSLLSGCKRLQQLSLRLADSLAKTILPTFARLTKLMSLTISNCSREDVSPMWVSTLTRSHLIWISIPLHRSERLVVSIAALIPNLSDLSLSRITRSKMHAPELVGVHPYVGLVIGDENIDPHPALGNELWLPSLLRLRRLKKLAIHDTHLGDPRWTTTPVHCRLEVVELGGFHMMSDEYNRACVESIMSAAGTNVCELSLGPMVTFANVPRPLDRLARLRLALFFPLDNILETLAAVASSPVECVEIQIWEDDLVDTCEHLKEFLRTKINRGPRFYEDLKGILVSVKSTDDYSRVKQAALDDRARARRRLEELCGEMRVFCHFLRVQETGDTTGTETGTPSIADWGRSVKN
jgi:hypothetical protein